MCLIGWQIIFLANRQVALRGVLEFPCCPVRIISASDSCFDSHIKRILQESTDEIILPECELIHTVWKEILAETKFFRLGFSFALISETDLTK